MAIQIEVQQANLDASCRLLERMFVGEEKILPNLVFGTTLPPIPLEFRNPQHPFTQDLLAAINQNMLGLTTYVTFGELHLDPGQVDQLQMQDPRIVTLKQRIKDEITRMPTIAGLRAERFQVIQNHLLDSP